jgi:hypothetical protein
MLNTVDVDDPRKWLDGMRERAQDRVSWRAEVQCSEVQCRGLRHGLGHLCVNPMNTNVAGSSYSYSYMPFQQ